ncbi:hypothetical protein GGR28_001887 [Lewinella aquimaris]|uniref:Lipoprotein n=1 Tax=Neolewinella aquimaris TaxID=1835722 RepID=A0A840E7N1_9BACT|nr:hypothetical protein [Neolewinella aquimaris]MBB4079267.1 hypothetical protein [Neolewinella aquimaris]
MRTLLVCGLSLILFGCYEESTGCLDPDADNYAFIADLACSDCCSFPELAIRNLTVWGDSTIVVGKTYRDGANNEFRIVRFRYYLGDLRLESSTVDLADPSRSVDLLEIVNGDTTDVTLNGNYLLATASSITTTTVGALRAGVSPLIALSGSYGLPDRFRNVIPASAPSGDALRTQPGRLNYRDGRGYVQSRLEYTLPPATDTLSVSSYGSVPFELSFGQEIPPARGFDIRLDLQSDLSLLLGTIDLSGDSSSVADGLNQAPDFIRVAGFVQ